jgi:hypothetical protein
MPCMCSIQNCGSEMKKERHLMPQFMSQGTRFISSLGRSQPASDEPASYTLWKKSRIIRPGADDCRTAS